MVYEDPLTSPGGLDVYEDPSTRHNYTMTVDVARAE